MNFPSDNDLYIKKIAKIKMIIKENGIQADMKLALILMEIEK